MTDASRTQAISVPGSVPSRQPSREAGNRSDAADSSRFADVWAESKATVLRREDQLASPEQMFESDPRDQRERRKTELRRDYRETVDRQSAARTEERTGVKARQSSTIQHQPTIEMAASMPVNNVDHQEMMGKGQPSGSDEQPHEKGTIPQIEANNAKLLQGMNEPRQQVEGRTATGNKQDPIPVSSANATQLKQVETAPVSVASTPQAAQEMARLLASPTAMNGVRDSAPIQGIIPIRAGQPSQSETNGAKTTGTSKEPAPSSPGHAKSPQEPTATDFERLIRLVRAQSGRQSSARVLLDPPALGKVHVRISVEGDRVEIGVETENESARDLISERATRLKTTLEEHGFVIDRFEVTTNQSGLFEQQMVSGQGFLRPRQDQGESGTGRSLSGRARAIPGKVGAAPALELATAVRDDGFGLDIRV